MHLIIRVAGLTFNMFTGRFGRTVSVSMFPTEQKNVEMSRSFLVGESIPFVFEVIFNNQKINYEIYLTVNRRGKLKQKNTAIPFILYPLVFNLL